MKKDALPLVIDAKKPEELNLSYIEEKEERERLKKWAKLKPKVSLTLDKSLGQRQQFVASGHDLTLLQST